MVQSSLMTEPLYVPPTNDTLSLPFSALAVVDALWLYLLGGESSS